MQYRTGTVTTTAASNVVTGDGTTWQSSGIQPSDVILIGSNPTPFEIASIDSETQLTLSANFPTTVSGALYSIVRDFTANRAYPLINRGDINAADIIARALRMIDADAQFGLVWGGSLIDIGNTPPGSPADGDTYGVDSAGTGAWSGHSNSVAVWDDGESEWVFTTPGERTYWYRESDGTIWIYLNSAWRPFTITISGTGSFIVTGDVSIGGDLTVEGNIIGKNKRYYYGDVADGNYTEYDEATSTLKMYKNNVFAGDIA